MFQVLPSEPPPQVAAPEIMDRLVMLPATTKTFNLAGAHIGNVIIPDTRLRELFRGRMDALGISPNSFGMAMATAAYSPEGAAWVDALIGRIPARGRLPIDLPRSMEAVRAAPEDVPGGTEDPLYPCGHGIMLDDAER